MPEQSGNLTSLARLSQTTREVMVVKRVAVHSGELISVGYDAKLQVLEVELSNHRLYQFVRVSYEVYSALMSASNITEYFKRNIMESYLVQEV